MESFCKTNHQKPCGYSLPPSDIIGENVCGVEEQTVQESCAHNTLSYNLETLYMHLLGVGFQHVTGLTCL